MEIYLFSWFINLDWPVISDRQQAISSSGLKQAAWQAII